MVLVTGVNGLVPVGTGRFTSAKHLGQLPLERRIASYRRIFEIKGRQLFNELINVDFQHYNSDACDPIVETMSCLRSFLVNNDGVFNDFLVEQLAFIIEPEAMAKLFSCLLATEKKITQELFPIDFISRALHQAIMLLDRESQSENVSRPGYIRARLVHEKESGLPTLDNIRQEGFCVHRFRGDVRVFWIAMRPADRAKVQVFCRDSWRFIEGCFSEKRIDEWQKLLRIVGY